MKTTILIIIALLPIISFGQWCDPMTFGILKAEVKGDSVILKDDTVSRNCGVQYLMKVNAISSDTLVWKQVDFGVAYGCYCHFNLSVTIDSLKPGNYTVKVYYSDSNYLYPCYVGSISFQITKPNSFSTPSILNQQQSDCFEVNSINENSSIGTILKVYPNPSSGLLNILTDLKGEKIIRVTDLENKCILEYFTSKNEEQIDLSRLPNMFYLISVSNKDKTVHAKFCKN